MSLYSDGIQYSCTEIGGRNLSDTNRYNMLPENSDRLNLDCSSNDTLWKDRALIELNLAILHSFKSQGVRPIDRHTISDYFMQFMQDEAKCQRLVNADWGCIMPSISGSATLIHLLELENRILKPNSFICPMLGKQINVLQVSVSLLLIENDKQIDRSTHFLSSH